MPPSPLTPTATLLARFTDCHRLLQWEPQPLCAASASAVFAERVHKSKNKEAPLSGRLRNILLLWPRLRRGRRPSLIIFHPRNVPSVQVSLPAVISRASLPPALTPSPPACNHVSCGTKCVPLAPPPSCEVCCASWVITRINQGIPGNHSSFF